MTLLDRVLAHGLAMPTDPIIAARIERHVRRIQPDPLFRRRLRSMVVNRYVATREGMVAPVTGAGRRLQVGALGRGVLYASLLTAVGTTAVGAASQESLPGDALYAVKLELEQIRMQIAPPGLRDDLAAMALDERLDELEQLAATGHWQLVNEAAERAAAAGQQLEALDQSTAAPGTTTAEDALQGHAERLEQLMSTAPASAQDGLQRALEASTGSHPSSGADNPLAQPAIGPAELPPRPVPADQDEPSSEPRPSAVEASPSPVPQDEQRDQDGQANQVEQGKVSGADQPSAERQD